MSNIDFEEKYRELNGNFGCPEDCQICSSETIKNIVLLPGEKDYLESIKFPCHTYGNLNGVDTMQINCSECGGCDRSNPESFFRQHRPIDCRTFPFVVLKDTDGYGLYLSTECPIAPTLVLDYRAVSRIVWFWEELLMYPEVRDSLDKLAELDQSDINPELSWTKISTLNVYDKALDENSWLKEKNNKILFWYSMSFFVLFFVIIDLMMSDKFATAGMLSLIWGSATFVVGHKIF